MGRVEKDRKKEEMQNDAKTKKKEKGIKTAPKVCRLLTTKLGLVVGKRHSLHRQIVLRELDGKNENMKQLCERLCEIRNKRD